jgi:mRNA interferase MazF
VVISQGDIWWADVPEPTGSRPGYRRPVVIVQADAFNRSAIRTVVCVAMTSNLKLANAPGNVLLRAREAGVPRPSVANVSQLMTLDQDSLTERIGTLSHARLDLILSGIDVILGR